jgi:glycine/D-amino acid oxidase-like deaminating enzyme
MVETADVVVIGGGIVGASVAYHLTDLGCRDVVVLERNSVLASGSTEGPLVGSARSSARRSTYACRYSRSISSRTSKNSPGSTAVTNQTGIFFALEVSSRTVRDDARPSRHQGEASEVKGFYLANGFSGHGVMHSPATGRVIAELILEGNARSIDISVLSPERFRRGELIEEAAILE